jgi:monoterpene epsilon-lactone hydrolase
MASLIAQATAFAVRIARIGGRFADERTLADYIKHHRAGPARPSAAMRRRFDISVKQCNGCEIYTVAPRAARSTGSVLYVHGGAYVQSILWWHWRFIAHMAGRLGMTFTVPLYPLAPEHDCAAASAVVLDVYGEFLARGEASQPVVMGDSAGGGLALSLTMQAIRAGLARPAGRWYAGAMSTTDPRVSPLYGDIAGLPPILMFCGTHDILVADARRLAARAAAEHADVEYYEEPGLMHVYPMLFFPESHKAQDRMAHFVRDAVAKSQPTSARGLRHDGRTGELIT